MPFNRCPLMVMAPVAHGKRFRCTSRFVPSGVFEESTGGCPLFGSKAFMASHSVLEISKWSLCTFEWSQKPSEEYTSIAPTKITVTSVNNACFKLPKSLYNRLIWQLLKETEWSGCTWPSAWNQVGRKKKWSERGDLNTRHPVPKSSLLLKNTRFWWYYRITV